MINIIQPLDNLLANLSLTLPITPNLPIIPPNDTSMPIPSTNVNTLPLLLHVSLSHTIPPPAVDLLSLIIIKIINIIELDNASMAMSECNHECVWVLLGDHSLVVLVTSPAGYGVAGVQKAVVVAWGVDEGGGGSAFPLFGWKFEGGRGGLQWVGVVVQYLVEMVECLYGVVVCVVVRMVWCGYLRV